MGRSPLQALLPDHSPTAYDHLRRLYGRYRAFT